MTDARLLGLVRSSPHKVKSSRKRDHPEIDFSGSNRELALGELVVQPTAGVVTELLAKWRAGDQTALEALVPLVYNELRTAAHRYLRDERPAHTLQSTALVHEAYLRLRRQGTQEFENRAHFIAIAAQLMRQILVEYARSRNAAKRNGGRRVTLDDTVNLFKAKSVDLVALDDALKELARLDPRQSRVVELRFFGGLSTEETAVVLGISTATVKRDWATARIWLHHEMSRSGSHDPGALAAG